MFPAQIAQGPDIPALHEGQEVQGRDCLAVPVQVGKQQEPGVGGQVPRAPQDDVFLLGEAVEDVEDPVETARGALVGDVGEHVGVVDCGCFGHEADALRGVLLDVLGGAGVD